jgi:hypothetical protein
VLLIAGAGCATSGRFLRRGIDCYNAGDYRCASTVFNQIEARRLELTTAGKLHYLTFRGLTFYRLAYWDLARRYLTEAFMFYRVGDPAALPANVLFQLNHALAALTGSGDGQNPSGPEPGPNSAEPIDIQ